MVRLLHGRRPVFGYRIYLGYKAHYVQESPHKQPNKCLRPGHEDLVERPIFEVEPNIIVELEGEQCEPATLNYTHLDKTMQNCHPR
eukprot:691898-Prymnesium_polylepis.1